MRLGETPGPGVSEEYGGRKVLTDCPKCEYWEGWAFGGGLGGGNDPGFEYES